jgi:hypothetical protein
MMVSTQVLKHDAATLSCISSTYDQQQSPPVADPILMLLVLVVLLSVAQTLQIMNGQSTRQNKPSQVKTIVTLIKVILCSTSLHCLGYIVVYIQFFQQINDIDCLQFKLFLD